MVEPRDTLHAILLAGVGRAQHARSRPGVRTLVDFTIDFSYSTCDLDSSKALVLPQTIGKRQRHEKK